MHSDKVKYRVVGSDVLWNGKEYREGTVHEIEGEIPENIRKFFVPVEEPAEKEEKKLESMKKDELVKMAEEMGIDTHGKTKAELIEEIKKHEEGGE